MASGYDDLIFKNFRREVIRWTYLLLKTTKNNVDVIFSMYP